MYEEGSYQGTPVQLPRPEDTKTLAEILPSAASVTWKELDMKKLPTYPIIKQGSSNQCTWFTIAKLLGINYLLDEGAYLSFSPSYGYEQRAGFPNPGDSVESIRATLKKGVTLEVLYPSKTVNNDNVKLNAKPHVIKVAEVFVSAELVDLPTGNIDAIASTMQATGKGVMLWSWADMKEWNQDVPKLLNGALTLYNAPVRHSNAGTAFGLYKGEKAIVIDESWKEDSGIDGHRILTESWIKKRNYYAGYVTKFTFSVTPVTQKPTKELKFGDKNADVLVLQKWLQQLGYFPANHGCTDYYGSITSEAVLKWQLDNKVDDEKELRKYAGRYFGPKSLLKV